MKSIQLICLANSWKHGDRCIAGIDLHTGTWVRPICPDYADDGRVPWKTRIINGYAEPVLLDVLKIPIAGVGSDFGFECENWAIAPGPWTLLRKASIQDIIPYIEFQFPILHTENRYVTTAYLQTLPFEERRTLQLIYAERIRVSSQTREGGGNKWKAHITTAAGQPLRNLTITDPEFADLLDRGLEADTSYLLTMSLSMPRKPLDWKEDDPDPCWKLIAGVLPLSRRDQILVEMQRLGWSIHQGRQHLLRTYGKRSRSELTDGEISEFIHHLQAVHP